MKKDAEVILCTGMRGSGKTTCQMELSKGRDRVIVLDPLNSFKAKGFKRVRSLAEMYRLMKEGWNTGFKIVLSTGASEESCIKIMQQLSRGLFLIQKPYYQEKDNRIITLMIDEAHKFFPNRRLTPVEQEPLENIICLGRHYGIEMIAATQRTAKMWTEYRGNCSQQYFFMQGDHTDFKAVLSTIGTDYQDQLRSLQPHEYLHKGPGWKITQGRNVAKFR